MSGAPEPARERARLRWQCRRGMRELDLLLQGFLDHAYDDAPGAERAAFQRLLDYPDPLLLEYLLGSLAPGDREIRDVIVKIRGAAAA
ncbi:MAG: succinate dehydrogenase assembly factor 2 [Gammaproteobacteria bacterium]|nr:succinate dehydrogenase assembly factor 2 [Gammaproteobacteria bacterium]